ncbi:MAG: S8 family peptidase [Saprospiraceae bacterium]
MKFKFFLLLALCFGFQADRTFAQEKAPENWFNLDPATSNVNGVSTDKTYNSLLKGKNSQPVIVAVLDSGVDYEHEDLKSIMWVNPGEIAGNGIDDDKNGYVDDVHGWNFIGGKDGKNVDHDTYEITRLYAKYSKEFKDVKEEDLSRKQKKRYQKYLKIKEAYEEKKKGIEKEAPMVLMLQGGIDKLTKHFNKKDFSLEDLNSLDTKDQDVQQAATMLKAILAQGLSVKDLTGYLNYISSSLDYGYNPDFNPRNIVGDNYEDSSEKYYGNNDVRGPDSEHGTHVAGIIAASRGNDMGMDGVANNVRIMSVRTVPNGDERDKDVANAIIYAVDNGAKIINMSFGKAYGTDKRAVDKAVKYAKKKDVLLIHSSGNDGIDRDETKSFPHDTYEKRCWFCPKQAKNWLEVGASSWKGGENLAAEFSNYGKENVDVFAPGVDIYSTVPDGKYKDNSGTSMASPVVSGIAAILRSYYPKLSAKQVKEAIMKSCEPMSQEVIVPGSQTDKKPFKALSVSGGVVNLYKAVQIASQMKGKKKVKKPNIVMP